MLSGTCPYLMRHHIATKNFVTLPSTLICVSSLDLVKVTFIKLKTALVTKIVKQ